MLKVKSCCGFHSTSDADCSPDPRPRLNTDRDVLVAPETPVQPDVDGGADGGVLTVEGVRHHQEMIRADGEELPVIGS